MSTESMGAGLERLKFDENGLIPAVIQDDDSGEVLMLAYMNRESLEKTLSQGTTWFYSRSRRKLWHKGETSGNFQLVKGIKADCDWDALLVRVEQRGSGACHEEGHRSCFHNPLEKPVPAGRGEAVGRDDILDELFEVILDRRDHPRPGSYTSSLFEKGLDRILKKLGEEAAETIIAGKAEDTGELIYESADLVYHLLVLFAARGITPDHLRAELRKRRSGGGARAAGTPPVGGLDRPVEGEGAG